MAAPMAATTRTPGTVCASISLTICSGDGSSLLRLMRTRTCSSRAAWQLRNWTPLTCRACMLVSCKDGIHVVWIFGGRLLLQLAFAFVEDVPHCGLPRCRVGHVQPLA